VLLLNDSMASLASATPPFRWTDALFIDIVPSRLDGHEGSSTMKDAERFRLLGTYQTPRFRIGQKVLCAVRGEVTIAGMTDAPIPWPLGKRGRGRHLLVVYKGLAKAVRRESNQAVAHWWGIDVQTVTKWRKALGVGIATEGTSRLHREYDKELWAVLARATAHAKARDPKRRAKIAEARRGKPRTPQAVAPMHEAWRGSHHSEETRRRMSEAHRKRGTLVPGTVPWTAGEDEWVKTLPAKEVVKKTGRSLRAVYARRRHPGMPDGRRRG
jgi:hypothetical protein